MREKRRGTGGCRYFDCWQFRRRVLFYGASWPATDVLTGYFSVRVRYRLPVWVSVRSVCMPAGKQGAISCLRSTTAGGNPMGHRSHANALTPNRGARRPGRSLRYGSHGTSVSRAGSLDPSPNCSQFCPYRDGLKSKIAPRFLVRKPKRNCLKRRRVPGTMESR